MSLLKYNLINSFTLIEFERIYEKVVYRAYANDISMIEAALIECPDILLSLSDEYMAGMINRLSESYRNILIICGYGQTRSIPHYLYYS